MKNIFTAACCAAIFSLASCGKKDASLISLLPVKPVVNPQTGILLAGTGLINVQMDANGTIRGLADSGRFETTDAFVTFQDAAVQLPALAQYDYRKFSWVSGLNIFSSAGTALPTTIGYSSDYGLTWHQVTPNFSGEPTAGYSYWPLDGVQWQGGNMLLLSTRYAENLNDQPADTMLVHRVDMTSGQAVRLLAKGGYIGESMQFTGADTGYIILDTFPAGSSLNATPQKGFFIRTTDGGSTWSQPVALNANEAYKLATGPDGRLLAYNVNTGNIAYSTDAGASWKKGNAGQMLYAVAIADDNTAYGITGDGLVKTTNFGGSWTSLGMPIPTNVTSVFFADASHGIAYSSYSLYSTADGGATWITLLYPYPYVNR
jgi:hypothetical protein